MMGCWNYQSIYCNPPYGRSFENKTSISNWIFRCSQAKENYKSEVLSLIPVATNTKYWKNFIFDKAACICFLYDTRLKFLINGVESKKGAPMACAMIYWGDNLTDKFKEIYSQFGKVILL